MFLPLCNLRSTDVPVKNNGDKHMLEKMLFFQLLVKFTFLIIHQNDALCMFYTPV